MKWLITLLVLSPPVFGLGALNPAVTQANIDQTICQPGWTDTVRPVASYTNLIKGLQMHRASLTGLPKDYEEDHVVPLELGGHPSDPYNLQPQPWPEARDKDRIENKLHRRVCAGAMPLALAQEVFINNRWKTQ